VPSGEVKILPKPQLVISEGRTTTLLLDFDVSRSFVQQGAPTQSCADLKQANKILFTPVVRAVNLEEAGLITGVVSDASIPGPRAGATVRATLSTDPTNVATTVTSDGSNGAPVGSYSLVVEPGTWDLEFEAPGEVTQLAQTTVGVSQVRTVDATFP
jgi:hypothetical protein